MSTRTGRELRRLTAEATIKSLAFSPDSRYLALGTENGNVELRRVGPAIVVSRDAINEHSPVVVIVPTTTYAPRKKIYPSQVLLRRDEGGLLNDSIALGDQVRTLSKSRLGDPLGRLSSPALTEISAALKVTLDL